MEYTYEENNVINNDDDQEGAYDDSGDLNEVKDDEL